MNDNPDSATSSRARRARRRSVAVLHERLLKGPLFAAKCLIEATLREPGGVEQFAHRGPLVAAPPERLHGGVQSLGRVILKRAAGVHTFSMVARG